jgi:hypothetical protein
VNPQNLLDRVLHLDGPVLKLRRARSTKTEHVPQSINGPGFRPRHEVLADEEGLSGTFSEAILTDLAMPLVLLKELLPDDGIGALPFLPQDVKDSFVA